MKNRNLQFPQDATVLDEPVRADGEDALADSTSEPSIAEPHESSPSSEARIELAAASESAPSPPDPMPPPALLDLPIASVLPPVASLLHTAAGATPFEDRIQRLEAELAELRTARNHAPRVADRQNANAAFDASSAGSAAIVRQPGHFWDRLGSKMAAPSGPSASPPPRTEGLSSMVPPAVRRTWMLLNALTELRAMYWMFFDPRYRLSWTARLAPLIILAMILTSAYWMPATSLPFFLGTIVEKVADLVLAYILFKLLSYESRRYRETAPDLPPSLRL